jgi:hypothetical protein
MQAMKKLMMSLSAGMLTTALSCAIYVFAPGDIAARAQETTSLAGTTWSGVDSEGDLYVFTFEPDGVLAYQSPRGSFRNGRWSQFRGAVYFHMNNHYSEYLGEISGRSIAGKGWNTQQQSWQWSVTPKN